MIGLKEEQTAVVAALMKLGCVEIRENENPGANEKRPARQNDELARLTRLEHIIEMSRPFYSARQQNGLGRRRVAKEALLQVAGREEQLLQLADSLEKNSELLAGLKSQINRLGKMLDLLQPWQKLDIDLKDPSTKNVKFYLGSVDTQVTLQRIKDQFAQELPQSHIEVVLDDEHGLRCVVAVLQTRAELALAILRRSGFTLLPETELTGTAARQTELIRQELADLENQQSELIRDNRKLAESLPELEVLYDFLLIRHDEVAAAAGLSVSQRTFWLSGWVPSHLAKPVQKGLQSKFLTIVQHEPAPADAEYPIVLRNNRFVKPYEVIVEMFSLPSSQENDPTPLLAPFFFFFFGMMLSDIGYGLALAGICGLLLLKNKGKGEPSLMVKMLFYCGISSALWGVLFGSFFGDMLSVLSQGRIELAPVWFNPMDNATQLMIWSMIFGTLHLFAGMAAKAWLLFQTGQGKDAILDIFPWFLIIPGLGLMIGGIGGQLGLYLALTGAAVLVLFGGRDAKNPLLRLMKGVLSLYDITGYLSDILSYTRILALVLATSVIAMVVNLLGFLGGPSLLGFLAYVAVALFGHALNLALSALSAYVHTSRLHYVEFFGKFYEGGGRSWNPLKIRTRYTQFEREETN